MRLLVVAIMAMLSGCASVPAPPPAAPGVENIGLESGVEQQRLARLPGKVDQVQSVEQADRNETPANIDAAAVQAALDAGLADTALEAKTRVLLPRLERAALKGDSDRIDQLASVLGATFAPEVALARLHAGSVRSERAREGYFAILNDAHEAQDAGDPAALEAGARKAADYLRQARDSGDLDAKSEFVLRDHLRGVLPATPLSKADLERKARDLEWMVRDIEHTLAEIVLRIETIEARFPRLGLFDKLASERELQDLRDLIARLEQDVRRR